MSVKFVSFLVTSKNCKYQWNAFVAETGCEKNHLIATKYFGVYIGVEKILSTH